MLVVSILEADEFGDELYPEMRTILTDILKMQHIGVIIAAGDSKGMIYRLFTEMAPRCPEVFFTILLSNDRLAYEGPPHIFSLDGDIAYGDPRTAKQRRREALIDRSDIVICRKKRCRGIREINRFCEIMVV